ncbi:hypothetical protein [Erwinia sp. 9145]|uniref:IclR family transcriptional regulator domain-containing protein n=1 Tax=Erwinia sp. 9145 TaxID=1500895 RepID=UPI000551515A|nr:hypothetical protein [Erwinia sp. 9145]
MSSQPNQSLIDGIRCLQYLVSSNKAIGCRELARKMGMNSTKVNRLLMTMMSVGLTMQDKRRRYLPGPGIHALAAQAIRGSSLFSQALPLLESHAPKDIVVAMGVLWEDQVIYLYHSKPGGQVSQALAGFHMLPAWESVIGMSLLAAESDEDLRLRFTGEQWQHMAPLLARQRAEGQLVWLHDDGEISIAEPLRHSHAALAFARIYDADDAEIARRRQQLASLAERLISVQL